jgi:hypothetical protein
LYVTPTCSAVTAVALLLPTPKMPPPAAPARRYAEYQNTPSRPSGNSHEISRSPSGLGGGLTLYFTPAASSSSSSFGSPLGGATVSNAIVLSRSDVAAAFFICPTMRGLPIVTSTSWPAFNFVLNSL